MRFPFFAMRLLTLWLFRLLAFCLCLWLGILPAFSQVEINVKLIPGNPDLVQFLRAETGEQKLSKSAPASLLAAYSFLNLLDKAQGVQQNTAKSLQGNTEVSRLFTLHFDDTQSADNLVQQLTQSGAFEFVEENRQIQLHKAPAEIIPTDDSLSSQWHHRYIQSFKAWEYTKGRPNIKVGVIDTGLDYEHPEFEGQYLVNSLEDANGNGTFEPWPTSELRKGISGDFDGLDNDNNGFVDDVSGYDFTDQPRNPVGGDYLFADPDPTDDHSHGTMVSGVIFAKHDNVYGGAGIAPDCKLLPIRAFGPSGAGEDDDIARAIIYGADQGVQILNFSFGDIYPSLIVHEAVKYAYSKGIIMVSSAGNARGDELHYPSGFSEVISVSASAADLSTGREYLFPLSSYGVTVDLCAPGAGIFTPIPLDSSKTINESFTRTQGTSFSAPMVTGAIALLFSKDGVKTPQQTRGILVSSVDDLSDPGWDHFTGAGRLNILRALEVVGASHVELLSPETDRGSDKDTVYIVGTALDPEFLRYHIEYQEGLEDQNPWIPIVSDQIYQLKNDTLAAWDLSGLPEGDYSLRLRVEKSNGFSNEDRIRFVRDKSAPVTLIKRSSLAWDNDERKALIIFRSSDQGYHTLNYRLQGTSVFKQEVFDRTTRNGEFLVGNGVLNSGTYEYFIETRNLAGLSGQSPTQTLTFKPEYISQTGFQELDFKLPNGRFLPKTYDTDKDLLKEVVMNVYDERLSFGGLKVFEFTGNEFVEMDSLSSFRKILIPKGVEDTDGDGLLELLCSVNDSTYLLEQETEGGNFRTQIWANEGERKFSANFGDTDGDGVLDLLLRDAKDFYVFKGSGGNFSEVAKLENITQDTEGPGLAQALVEDFDQDGRPEILFGDNDADFLIYEHSGGDAYVNVLADTSYLANENAEVFFEKGDFDQDGKVEFMVAIHTSDLENADKEFDTPHWVLRIFKATANNEYEVIWEDVIYDIDSKTYNALSVGNLDTDGELEIVFSTFPKTYIIDYRAGEFKMDAFIFGSIGTHHIIADFNGNGVNELGLGISDSTYFFEKDYLYTGPAPVFSLKGEVLGPNKVRLDWLDSPGAVGYELWRVANWPNSSVAAVFSPVLNNEFEDQNLDPNVPILYVLRTLGATDTSGFGQAILLTPHQRPIVDSLKAITDNQVAVYFSQRISDRPEDKAKFLLNGTKPPISITKSGDLNNRLILGFRDVFKEGVNTLQIDSTFRDQGEARLSGNRNLGFVYEKKVENSLFLTSWEATGDKTALLQFNLPPTESTALDTSNYAIEPLGSIKSVAWGNEEKTAVLVSISEARLGALGYPISLVVSNVCTEENICTNEEGNTATFSSNKEDLTEVFVYPNPARNHEFFDGVRFANLTRQAYIEVFTVSGRFVNKLEETDGDGGYEWDLRDKGKQRIKPGIYIFRVSTEIEGIEDFVGKLSVVE